jgi:spore maturation protein CgeB
MKVLIITPAWIGGLFDSITEAFLENGADVIQLTYVRAKSWLRTIKLNNIVQIKNSLDNKSIAEFNEKVSKKYSEFKPDIFLTMNESSLYPSTIEEIQKKGCLTVNFVADNPFDPLRFSYYPISLKYYTSIFIHDKIWLPAIRNVAPGSKLIKFICGGAFNPNLFFQPENSEITLKDSDKFSCDVSFTGESYGMRGEAGYRSDILNLLGKYNVKLWGDAGWKSRFAFNRNLVNFYQGGRLPYDELRKLYRISTINLNMPSPQIFTGFQPRTFEIAACKGFQIADYREELDEWFTEDELITFKNIPDLLEKIEYFVKYPEQRTPYIEKMHEKVINNHTWKQQAKKIIDTLNVS